MHAFDLVNILNLSIFRIMKQTVTITGENMNVVVNEMKQDAKKPASKAEMRIAALKASGIDTSMYFPLGEDKVIKLEDGVAVPVEMADDTERKIIDGGYVNHYKLFRRWTMAQMFDYLRRMDNTNFNELLQLRGYEYSWKVLVNELNAQSKMEEHGDDVNLRGRNRWFNVFTARYMAEDYISKLQKYIENNLMWNYTKDGKRTPKHTCKGVHYIRLGRKNIFVTDIASKVIKPLRDAANDIFMTGAVSYSYLFTTVKKFNSMRFTLRSTKQCDSFIDAYKGSGAYYTMRNLIMFHGARFASYPTEASSLVYVDQKAIEYTSEGWRMLGVLKQLIAESGISVDGKISEWRNNR